MGTQSELSRLLQVMKLALSPLAEQHRDAMKKIEAIYSQPRTLNRPYISHYEDASRQDPHSISHTIPLRTKTAAGPASDYQDGIFADRFLPSALIPRPDWAPAAMVIAGDSMAPRFMPGDFIFVGERLQRVRTGDIVVVGFAGGEHTVKNLRIVDDATWELIPTNPAHPTQRVKRSEVEWFAPVLGHFSPLWTRREVPWDADG
jgi:phage repressor protein C with HTH and peptisase S24 domain